MNSVLFFDIIIGIIYLGLALFVLLHNNEKTIIQFYFSFFCIFTGSAPLIESLCYYILMKYNRYIWVLDNIKLTIFIFGIITAFVFAVHFPDKKTLIKKRYLALIYSPMIYFIHVGINHNYFDSIKYVNQNIIKTHTINYILFTLFLTVYLIMSIIVLIRKYLTVKSSIYKIQLRLFFIGAVIASFFMLFLGLMPLSIGINLQLNGLHIGPLIFCLFIFYAIFRYNALDIRTAIHYTFIWLIGLGIIIIPLLILPNIINIPDYLSSKQNQISIWGIGSIIYYILINKYLIHWLKKIAKRKNTELTTELEKFNEKLGMIKSLNNLQTEVFSFLNSNIYIQDIIILTLNNQTNLNGFFEITKNSLTIEKKQFDWTKEFSNIITDKILKDYDQRPELINHYNIKLISKLIYQDQLLGYILLTGKSNLKPYDYEEIKFLEKLSKYLANFISRIDFEEKSISKTMFFMNLAHEIKTPLTLITNYLNKYISQQGLTFELEVIKSNIEKLCRDIVNFLDLEKLERNQIFYNHDQIVNLTHMLKQKILLFIEVALKKNIQILQQIEQEIYVQIDPFAMDRIINNLMDNALKYTKEGGVIHVDLTANIYQINLSIKDSGIGISDNDLKHIFKPYYQIGHKKRNIQGIGMGLTIVKKIMEELKADIKVESQLNRGTSMVLTFKRYYLKNKDQIPENLIYSKPIQKIDNIQLKKEYYDKNHPTLFIIEDNIEMLAFLQQNLLPKYNIFYEFNGENALKKIFNLPSLNIIISDVMMDGMDGYQFYNELLKNNKFKSIPFIFLTARNSIEEKIKALKKGAIDFIYKPFHFEELASKLDSLIKIQDALKEENINKLGNKFYQFLEGVNLKKSSILSESDSMVFLYRQYGISHRQIEIISLLQNGLEQKEISAQLGVSINTVKTQISRIYEKCGVNNKIELIKIFQENYSNIYKNTN